MKLYNILIFRLAVALIGHGLKMPILATSLFGPQFFVSQHFDFLSNVIATCLVFCMTHSYWRSLSNGCMFLCSTMLSDKQSEHSFSPATLWDWSLFGSLTRMPQNILEGRLLLATLTVMQPRCWPSILSGDYLSNLTCSRLGVDSAKLPEVAENREAPPDFVGLPPLLISRDESRE